MDRRREEDIEMGVMNRGYSHDEDQDSNEMRRALNQEEKEERTPRNVCWYTFTRVLSALLIIGNVVLDWLQYFDIKDPITDIKDKLSDIIHAPASSEGLSTSDPLPKNASYCTDDSVKDELTKKFMYFTIAGSVLSAFQLAKIIYQIVLNHKRDPAETIPDKIDGKVEVFFTTLFVEIPQNYLLLKYDNIICFNCEIEWNGKKIKRFLNGLGSELASVWRYITSSKCCDGSGGVVKRKVQRSNCCCCSCCSGALCTRMFWTCVEGWFPCVILCRGYEGCSYLTCSYLTYNSGFFWWNCCPFACCYSCCEGPKCKSCEDCFKCDNCCKCCDNCCKCFDNCCNCSDVSCGQCLIDCLLSIIRFFGGIFTTLYTAMYVLRVLEYFCVVLPTEFAEAFVSIMDTVFGWILN